MSTRTAVETLAATKPMVKITEMDHIVLRVKDVDVSLRFYNEVLGLKTERVDQFKAGEVRFPSIRINDDTIIDLFPFADQPGIGKGKQDVHHRRMGRHRVHIRWNQTVG